MSLIIRETRIKTNEMSLHTCQNGWYQFKKVSVGKNVEKLEPLCTVGPDAKWRSASENNVEVLEKKMELPCGLAISLLGIYPKTP
jgi:hypothetical protein